MPRNVGDSSQPRRLLRQAKAGGGGAGRSLWLQAHPSVTLCPLTTTLMEASLVRIAVDPSPRNGLRKPSQLMVDKLFTVPIEAVGAVVGQLEPQAVIELDLALRGWLELP